MLGVYRHIPFLFEEKGYEDLTYLASDFNESVIEMWKAAQKGWKPPKTCSKRKYNTLKRSPVASAEKGFCRHQFSFRNAFFSSYGPDYGKSKDVTSAASEIAEDLFDVRFYYGSYDQFSNLKGYVIYCDPPYQNTTCDYVSTFDNSKFWDWIRMMSRHNIVLVSEYTAPKDFKTINAVKTNVSTYANTKTKIEKLFTV